MDAYIVGGYRTAVGKAPRGLFKFTRPDDLAADVIKPTNIFRLIAMIYNKLATTQLTKTPKIALLLETSGIAWMLSSKPSQIIIYGSQSEITRNGYQLRYYLA